MKLVHPNLQQYLTSEDFIQIRGNLFEHVQCQRIFKDSKSFVDCYPLYPPNQVLQAYNDEKLQPGFDLSSFVKRNFVTPSVLDSDGRSPIADRENISIESYIQHMWTHLYRESEDENSKHSTVIRLPHPYVVPGGRFREVYYWDSYFTVEGLAISGNTTMVLNMIQNFSYLIQTIGHIPNGTRVYYLSRSQPPFFCSMLNLLERLQGTQAVLTFLPSLEKEYQFWMKGHSSITTDQVSSQRVVMVDNSSQAVLNRYWDDNPVPREESWVEDTSLFQQANEQQRINLFRNIRAACESGMDFSSRWCKVPTDLASIRTTEILPIDLNCLLYNMELHLAKWFKSLGQIEKSAKYEMEAATRKRLINEYMWNEEQGFFFDYCWTEKSKVMESWSIVGAAFPLFFRLATEDQAKKIAAHIQSKFLKNGGVVTTLESTSHQWDSPNTWAPHVYMIVEGLENYNMKDLATDIASRWLKMVKTTFQRDHKMLEKYNAVNTEESADGGEYPLQDGFGWTNGVTLCLLRKYENTAPL